jgi:hypothetical protein
MDITISLSNVDCQLSNNIQQPHHFPPQLRKNLHILTTQTWILCRIKVEKQGENRTLWLAKKHGRPKELHGITVNGHLRNF